MSFFGKAYEPFVPFGGSDPDFAKLREVANGLAPHTEHNDIRIIDLDAERAVAQIPDVTHLHNHVGTVHAAALYLGAEFCAAAAFVGTAAAHLERVEWMVVRDCRAVYTRPATGTITATATVDLRAVRELAARGEPGRLDVDAKAVLRDPGGAVVGKVYFDYVCQIS
ncbi:MULTISPECIES: DUF4442 domain-containing protein [unclassified Gordonia (in: high G+C Gram-positive bacteria)]|uniref:DUF4442 domain-containing protein n=1 Tax=unclassified Gordonia (in: high G+C Gram-positive bacteria) TaxID=2657482 RepID=UPI0009AE47F7|nr:MULTISPECIES: DUF4442 domain-containing protein [unclassified Gordonia (in: high G+C Gram-positive bacteria)]MDF3284440.1 DUF4442 domain-containing protein [Gordonia sp. N1V]OPX16543.1 DUF4442 domain-containing protein [Gordonia sp. i37]